MKRSHVLMGLLVLATAAGVGYAMFTSNQQRNVVAGAPASAPDAASIDAEMFAQPRDCGTEEAESMTTLAASCGRCPPEWPRCYRDRDCDSVCGGKGTGVCEWINSCFKCCTCGGTT